MKGNNLLNKRHLLNTPARACLLLSLAFSLYLINSVSVFATNLTIVPRIDNLPKSWAIGVSPSNQLFITERAGKLHQYTIDEKQVLAGFTLVSTIDLGLTDLYNKGQGGLLAIAFDPNYAQKPWIYLSYSFGDDDANGLKVIRVKIKNKVVVANEVVFTQSDLRNTPVHYAGRIAFAGDGDMLISLGDGFDFREQAQVKLSQLGKILKIGQSGKPSVYSIGHRNPQALLVLNNGQIIAHEHGPDGGDEINFIYQGNNYGWPVITQGRDYLGGLISPFVEYEGMQQAAYDWTPSIAPSGMIFYSSHRIPQLTNQLLVTSLKFQQLHALALHNKEISNEHIYFAKSGHRMRDISQTKSGRVFILSDGAQNANSTILFEVASK